VKDEGSTGLETIKDESEDDEPFSPKSPVPATARLGRLDTQSQQSLGRKQRYRARVESPTETKDKTSPQSTGSSSGQSQSQTPASSRPTTITPEVAPRDPRWKALKPDIQKYLAFQQEHLTYYHYFLKLDPSDFVHTELIELALTYEPLLYAVVAFAAYHHSLQIPDGKLSNFLGYYSKSLTLLRKSLEKQTKASETNPATLLTVLQLAVFEEYLGDWVNLVGHHRAAHAMLLQLYTVDNVMETDTSRRIFDWYARFDVIAGLMAGNETILPRDWYTKTCDWYEAQIDVDPDNDVDIDNTLAYFFAANRVIGFDMASLFSKLPKGEMSMETFNFENATISERLRIMKHQIQKMNDGYYTVNEFPMEKIRPLNEEDIVNPYIPGGLFRDAYWPMNFIWIDWYSIEEMQQYQTSIIRQQPIPVELGRISLEQCRIYEAIDRWPDAPEGAILGAHASLGLASVFLKKDYKHTMWARRKLASVERRGYIFPPTFRKRLANMWQASECGNEGIEEWWLPNDEGRIPLLNEIRSVVAERNEISARSGGDGKENLRDLKAIFSNLNIRAQAGVEGLSPGSDSGSQSATSATGMSQTQSHVNVNGLEETARGQSRRQSRAGLSNRMSGIWEG